MNCTPAAVQAARLLATLRFRGVGVALDARGQIGTTGHADACDQHRLLELRPEVLAQLLRERANGILACGHWLARGEDLHAHQVRDAVARGDDQALEQLVPGTIRRIAGGAIPDDRGQP